MKTLLNCKVLIFTLCLLCIMSVRGVSQIHTSPPDYLNCSLSINYCNTPWANSIKDVEVPGYPGCFLRVNFGYRDCWGKTEIQIGGVETFGNCGNMINDVFPNGLGNGVDEEVVRRIWKDTYNRLVEILFEEFYNSLDPNFRYLLECPNGEKEFHIIEGSCTALCMNYYPDEHGGTGVWTIRYNRCTNSCCVFGNVLCYDTALGKVVRRPRGPFLVNDDGTLGSCPAISLSNESCTGGVFNISQPCKSTCTP